MAHKERKKEEPTHTHTRTYSLDPSTGRSYFVAHTNLYIYSVVFHYAEFYFLIALLLGVVVAAVFFFFRYSIALMPSSWIHRSI